MIDHLFFIESWCFGWIEEIPGVNCQEYTREELLESFNLARKICEDLAIVMIHRLLSEGLFLVFSMNLITHREQGIRSFYGIEQFGF